MAAITAALIKQVREETGAGMMDVKKALTEAEEHSADSTRDSIHKDLGHFQSVQTNGRVS